MTLDELRELARFRASQGRAISVYLNFDPSVTPTAGDAVTRINSVLGEGEKSEAAAGPELSHAEREALKGDFDRIRRYVQEEFDRDGAQGLAVFAAAVDGVWRPLRLSEPVDDHVAVGAQFALAPLVPLVGRETGTLVAVVSRERGDIYRLEDGRLEEVADRSEDLPGHHDQGGWSQARYQRRIDNMAQEHIRAVAEEIDLMIRRRQASEVVVVCVEEIRSDFASGLSQEAQAAIVGWTSAEAHASPAALLEVVTPVLEQARAKREADVVERWQEERGRDGRATAGWAETLAAASDGRVETLLFQERVARAAWQCPQCGRAEASPGQCALDGTELVERADGLGAAVQQTLVHGGTVSAVRHRQDLEPSEGIAALLRY
ncbi:MAG: hypothetical protein M3M94_06400 [Actinomycetota bacterium]|nr:hypothetical protein [Actinomycetota bacterium]